jgi:hypothetical protein
LYPRALWNLTSISRQYRTKVQYALDDRWRLLLEAAKVVACLGRRNGSEQDDPERGYRHRAYDAAPRRRPVTQRPRANVSSSAVVALPIASRDRGRSDRCVRIRSRSCVTEEVLMIQLS